MNHAYEPPKAETFGVYQTYPPGIFNPAFTGMFLWDLRTGHDLNQYKICKFHSIQRGIILYGNEAFVFTQLSNNDIHSYVKILLRGNLTSSKKAKVAKLILNYIRSQSRKPIIPDIPTIKRDLVNIVGLDVDTFAGDEKPYLIMLYRIYMLTYMAHYKMPIQRKNPPGNRNQAFSSQSKKSKGWYSYLTSKEQSILSRSTIFISNNSIPDDLIDGICLDDMKNCGNVKYQDQQNSIMFRDGSKDSMSFQQQIQIYQHQYSSSNQRLKSKNSETNETSTNKICLSGSQNIEEVPDILSLKEMINTYISELDPSYIKAPTQSWNAMFHKIIGECKLSTFFPINKMPECYKEGKSCGHALHVELIDSARNVFYLTMLESNKNFLPAYYSKTVALFIHSVIFRNPVWDIGLQFLLSKKNGNKINTLHNECLTTYSSNCVCPCSRLLSKWHEKCYLNKLHTFEKCDNRVFDNPIDFVNHLHSKSGDYYHRIIMKIVQSLYSSLLAKLKTKQTTSDHLSSFASIHKGKVTLPAYVMSGSKYDLFTFKRYEKYYLFIH